MAEAEDVDDWAFFLPPLPPAPVALVAGVVWVADWCLACLPGELLVSVVGLELVADDWCFPCLPPPVVLEAGSVDFWPP